MKVYFDASALAKGYLREPGTDQVRELMVSADSVGTSVLCLTEVVSALCRNRRERRLSDRQYRDSKSTLLGDLADMDIVPWSNEVVDRSVELLESDPVRASDALHIAAALEWQADSFISSDKRQLDAAHRAGLTCIVV